jgi:HSP20 family protein
MANITRRPGGERMMPSPRREMNPFRMMEELLGWDPFRAMTPFMPSRGEGGEMMMFNPQFEVKENKDGYVFKADLPGVKDNDIDIQLSGNMLTITGKREAEEREENETFFAFERQFGTFSRSFTLPDGADADHVRADLRDGVLTVMVPKRPEMQPKRISVKASGGTGQPMMSGGQAGQTGGKEKPKA